MNKTLKRLLLGLLPWLVPFITSFAVWDIEKNIPSIPDMWFSALMAFTWALGFAIAAYLYFKDIKTNTIKEGIITGIIWYIQALFLDFIFLVTLFGMLLSDFYPMLLTYANALMLCIAIGLIKK